MVGSVHDNRIWKNPIICQQCDEYFSSKEYALGDLAFNNSTVMVSAYKKVARSAYLPSGQQFNDVSSKPRSSVENSISIWKSWFSCLHSIRVWLKKKESMKRIIKYILASTAVLQHLFIRCNWEGLDYSGGQLQGRWTCNRGYQGRYWWQLWKTYRSI